MINYGIEGILVSILPYLENNNKHLTDANVVKNIMNTACISNKTLLDWLDDPYYTILFSDRDNNIVSFNKNRTICRIYMNRPEYKCVDPSTDLILNIQLANIFLALFRLDKNNSNPIVEMIRCAEDILLENYGIRCDGLEIYATYKLPEYYRIPILWGDTITYLLRGVKDLL